MILKVIIIVYGFSLNSNTSFSQKNTIGLELAPIHTFFYDTPLFLTKQYDYPIKFGKRIHDSWKISYDRKINKKNEFGASITWFATSYMYNEIKKIGVLLPQAESQSWFTFSLLFTRNKLLKKRLSFIYGAGFNYRKGSETIFLSRIKLGPPQFDLYEILSTTNKLNDLGIDVFTGIKYQAVDWLELTTKIDLLSTIYQNDKEFQREMKIYHAEQFSSHFDLSLSFGIGITF